MIELKIEKNISDQVLEELSNVEKLLDERISELHEVPGGMQSRHAFILYRDELFKARIKLRDNLNLA